jgi:hypothetical protein
MPPVANRASKILMPPKPRSIPLNSAFGGTNQAGRDSILLPILNSIQSLNGKAVAPAKPINPKSNNPETIT